MFPLRFSPFAAALVLLVGVGAAVLSAPPTHAAGGAWIGVKVQSLDDDLRESMNIDRHVQGALVSDVMDDSPAEEAGFMDGDVIVEVDGRRTTEIDEVTRAIRDLEPGEKATIVVSRNGQTRGLTIVPRSRDQEMEWTAQGDDKSDRKVRKIIISSDKDKQALKAELEKLGEGRHKLSKEHAKALEEHMKQLEHLEEMRAEGKPHMVKILREKGGYLGVQSMELGQMASYFGVAEGEGVLVTEVVGDSPASEAGLKAGDVILAVGDESVGDPEELREAVRDHKPEETVTIAILRRGERSSISVKLGGVPDMKDSGMLFMSPEDADIVIPEIPRIPRIDIEAPNLQWIDEDGVNVLRLDEEELQKFKLELKESMDELREQLQEMKRELRKIHEDDETD